MKRFAIAERWAKVDPQEPDILASYTCDGQAMTGLVCIGAGSTDHFWERHDGGDELLLVMKGAACFTAVRKDGVAETLNIGAGDLLILERGEAHQAHISEDLHIMFMTPRDGNVSWSDDGDVPLRHLGT